VNDFLIYTLYEKNNLCFMILDESVKVIITNRNIRYYKELGYDVQSNKETEISLKDLNKNSLIKINSKCDICGFESEISYQNYNKSFKNGGYYCCKKCSYTKVKIDIEKISKRIIESKRIKYDKITNYIQENGYSFCKKCNNRFELDKFRKTKLGRYILVCNICRSNDFKNYYKNLDHETKKERKRRYYRNSIHINLWRSILKSYLFRRNKNKLDETISLLGYSSNDLKKHLESKFDKYMSWETYGKYWQVDHIIPVSFFKESTPINMVNSLENLRPLEKNYNLSRGNKLDDFGLEIFKKYKTYIKIEYINIYKNKI
jgi:5-methylcytosine-specific restriction endonuclease McrA